MSLNVFPLAIIGESFCALGMRLLLLLFLSVGFLCFGEGNDDDFATNVFKEMSKDGKKVVRSDLKEALHIRIFNDVIKAKNLRGQKEITKDDFFSYLKANAGRYGETAKLRGETIPDPPKPERRVVEEAPVRRTPPKYPSYIPEWFKKLDEDWDGQVGLWEWRRAGFSIADWRKLDTNEDGLFTPDELRRMEGWVAEDWDAKPIKWILKPGGKRIDFEPFLANRKVNPQPNQPQPPTAPRRQPPPGK